MNGRIRLVPAALALTLAMGGCDDSATEVELDPSVTVVTAPVEVTLPQGEEVRVGDALRLVFTQVVGDSRCPVDVTCVWEGNAVVEVSASLGTGPSTPLQFNSTLEPRSVVWNGIRIGYVELLPRPVSSTPPPDDFTLTVLVEPIG